MSIFSNTTTVRDATADDIIPLAAFMLEHGANEWNYLPKDEIKDHLAGIASGETLARIALCDGTMAGMVSFNIGEYYLQYETQSPRTDKTGYIAEAVIHRAYAGKGLGTMLMEDAKQRLREHGVRTIYIKRHEENLASAGMMRKAGFSIVDTFSDPIRTSGSGRTTVERFRFP